MNEPNFAYLALTIFFAACAAPNGGVFDSDMKGGDGSVNPNGVCSPGMTKACICLGGGMGTQVCRDTGTSFGQCTGCANAPDGGLKIGDAGTGGNACGTCDGCCQGTTCVPFASETNTECGAAGTTCTSCGANTCDSSNGSCISAGQGCGASCTGCCGVLNGQPHCYVNTPNQCGSNNGTCMTCASGTTCNNGACGSAIDPSHNFTVTISTAQVYNTDGMGNTWDYTFTTADDQPDLFVCFTTSAGTGCTTVINNVPIDNGMPPSSNTATDTATWTGTDGVLTSGGSTFYVPGSALINGSIQVNVFDQDDTSFNDTIGSANSGKFTNSATNGFDVGPFNRVVNVHFQIK